jgi:hypothetical protein
MQRIIVPLAMRGRGELPGNVLDSGRPDRGPTFRGLRSGNGRQGRAQIRAGGDRNLGYLLGDRDTGQGVLK